MSEVLKDLMREKQMWLERPKYSPSFISSLINIGILLLIGFSIYKIIENPSVVGDVVRMFI